MSHGKDGNEELTLLIEAAGAAYQRARREVYDTIPAGQPVVVELLAPRQRCLIAKLMAAESDLAIGRRQIHGPFASAC